ncbi:MAG TPA: hypothetical protein VGS19_32010, partial [Streptosporangiaceae bacterium]|nr:hypothetical protein [Streptosporangiaceae bacterium]
MDSNGGRRDSHPSADYDSHHSLGQAPMRPPREQALLDELDELAPELLASGRPSRLLDRHGELTALDLRGHPWARLLVACVAWDAKPATPLAWRHARAAHQAFICKADGRGEAFACFVLGCWMLTEGRLTE